MLSQPVFSLRVDFLPPGVVGLPGRLGLTRAPGRYAEGRSLDGDERLREDLEVIAGLHGARVLVTLLERFEIGELGDLRRAARRAGLAWVPFPIPDMWIPGDLAATRRLVRRLVDRLARGHDVVIHCWGGLGRTGTIAACVLVAAGRPPAHAVALVRAARPGAVQNDAQEQFVHDFAAALGT